MPGFRIRRALPLAICVATLATAPLRAVEVIVGRPNTPPGANGLDATASAISPDPSNHAFAGGGDGGSPTLASPDGKNGGSGFAEARTDTSGDASANAEARGGRGSAWSDSATGGIGGNATSDAQARSQTGNATATSTATAGDGGGFYPPSTGTGTLGAGDGGMARATGNGEATGAKLTVNVSATAGVGGMGNPAGDGGDASARADGTLFGSGTADVRASAIGGRGGDVFTGSAPLPTADGGNAECTAVGAVTGSASLTLSAYALGGSGSSAPSAAHDADGGTGGNAIAHADGRGTGSGRISVTATAVAGAGGGASELGGPTSTARVGGQPGVAQVSAYGESTGGGDVTVQTSLYGGDGGPGSFGADGARGSDVTLVDAASGSTSGTLTLIERASAGRGGGNSSPIPRTPVGLAGAGGDARVEADAQNPGGGALSLQVESNGGLGGSPVSTSTPSHGGVGGAAVLRAHGSSDVGARVEVVGTATGGSGFGTNGDGFSMRLDDAVTGSTSGALRLEQNARGGNGGEALVGDAGRAGDASSRLTHEGNETSLELKATATGGLANNQTGGDAPHGGDADVFVSAHNTGGSVKVTTSAQGGNGSSTYPNSLSAGTAGQAGDGGVATSRASATSEQAVGDVTVTGSARGGDAGNTGRSDSHAGDGGMADSQSTGVALGEGAVTVSDSAGGGYAGLATQAGDGNGGDASSRASAENHGARAVSASASAYGGGSSSNGPYASLGRGGAATASASAISYGGGDARATVYVQPGSTSGPFDGRDTIARNLVSGATSGHLTLIQEAYGGSTNSGRGGNLIQSLEAENTLGGDLSVTLYGAAGGGARGVGSGDASLERLALHSASGADLAASITMSGGNARIDPGTILLDTRGNASLDVDLGGNTASVNLAQEVHVASYALDLSARGGEEGDIDVDLVSDDGPVTLRGVASGSGSSAASGGAASPAGKGSFDVSVVTHGDAHDIALGSVGVFDESDPAYPEATARGEWGANPTGNQTGGTGADATSRSRAVATGDSMVRVVDSASGGYGGQPRITDSTGSGGDGGNAVSSAYGENAGASPVMVLAVATAGGGGSTFGSSSSSARGGNAGTATLGQVFGRSTGGGDVRVIGIANGADGGLGRNGPDGTATEVHLANAVDGDTSGNLVLEQYAYSGSQPSAGVDASSALSHESRSASLTVVTEADAGNSSGASRRGEAIASSGAYNESGRADARARAFAGSLYYDAPGGHGSAEAAGRGMQGSLLAQAETSVPLIDRVVAEASADLAGSASVAADVRPASTPGQTSGSHDLALSANTLLGANPDTWTSQRPGLAAEIRSLGLDTLVTDARYAVGPGQGAGHQLGSVLEVAFNQDDSLAVEHLHLFLVDGESSGDETALQDFVLKVSCGDFLVLEKHAKSLSELDALFAGSDFSLGDGFDEAWGPDGQETPPLGALRAELTWTSRDAGWHFDGSVVVAGAIVPEPDTALLVVIGIAAVALHRRMRSEAGPRSG